MEFMQIVYYLHIQIFLLVFDSDGKSIYWKPWKFHLEWSVLCFKASPEVWLLACHSKEQVSNQYQLLKSVCTVVPQMLIVCHTCRCKQLSSRFAGFPLSYNKSLLRTIWIVLIKRVINTSSTWYLYVERRYLFPSWWWQILYVISSPFMYYIKYLTLLLI